MHVITPLIPSFPIHLVMLLSFCGTCTKLFLFGGAAWGYLLKANANISDAYKYDYM